MQSTNQIFHEKNVTKALIQFAIPGILTILMAELYNMVDTFFVGRYVSDLAIGALGIAFPVQRLFIALSLLIGVGTSTLVARSLGEGNHKKIGQAIGNGMILGFALFSILPIVVFWFRSGILQMLGAGEAIYPLANSYVSIILMGSLFLSFTNIIGYSLTALGHPRVTLAATSIGSFVNILVDYILVGKVHMGVEGAAIATVASQFLGFCYAVYMLRRVKKERSITLEYRFSRSIARVIVAIGFATFIVEISDAVLIGVLNNILSRTGGDKAVIMVGAITRISMFLYITMLGISSGMQPLASFFFGAKDDHRLKTLVRSTCLLSGATSFFLWILLFFFAPTIIGSFLTTGELLDETVKAFHITITVFPIISIYYVSIYYYQAVGQAGPGFFLSIYRQLLLFIPLLLVLVHFFGVWGAWITYPITDVLSGLTGIAALWRGVGKTKGGSL